jgi:hypothetical protein
MLNLRTFGRLLLGLGALAVLAVGLRTRRGDSGTSVPLDDWDVPRLTAFLNEHGLGLRVVPTMQNGQDAGRRAYLTATDKEWEALNSLMKDPRRIDEWRGTLYCLRGKVGENWEPLTERWGATCLVIGPFLLYGDPELLALVRDAVEEFIRSNGTFPNHPAG